ncbi:SCO family protein [Bacillus sp. EAC]|uniref:SCO family protein n=1 Tax=Bacillus sp. EAC TaxID=1978338 RepID=UPI000B43F25A|nr:SCO family protein [Bacillus sp. EAC]
MKKYAFSMPIVLFLCLAILSGCGNKIQDPLNWDLEKFTYKDQEGKTFGSNDLKGKVWLTDFIFTSCETVCPPMTANFSKLQRKAAEKKLNVDFVSFSIDPEVDTPNLLKTYANKFDADLNNWHFLTGYSQNTIEKFVSENFKTIVKKPENNSQVIHGTKFYLIDQKGKIVKDYSGVSNVQFDEILSDIEKLTK